MERGWNAAGLLEPLWARVGGRDKLAALTGVTGPTLSGYNTGRLQLGVANARKIAAALEVSLLELGAPADLADAAGQGILVRLEALEDALNELGPELTDLGDLVRRVRALERQAPRGSRRAGPASK